MAQHDMLGAALVERLLHQGADIVAADDGELHVFFPEPGNGRRPNQENPWLRGFTDGAMRELWKVVQLVPGAREAMRVYVRLYPRERYAEGLIA